MPKELLNNQNKPFLRWKFDAENNWLYLNWIGFVSKENLILGATEILKVIQQNHYVFLLNDNRELCGPWDKGLDWVEENFIPQVKEAGLRYFAHVLSPGIAGALSAQNFHNRVDNTINVQLFGDMEKAKAWLKSAQQAVESSK